MNTNKFLPVGTVVLLKEAKKKLMITGFCSIDQETKTKVYDYTGCMYPEGIINSNQMALFNHSQIDKIYYMGYVNEEEKEFKKFLKEELDKLQKEIENK